MPENPFSHGRRDLKLFVVIIRHIYRNIDKMGVLWRSLSETGFGHGKECRGGKKTKQRITNTFLLLLIGLKNDCYLA